jgi:hypothetical protein
MLGHRIDKTVAGIGMALPARFQHMTQQEQSRELETILQVLVGPAVRAAGRATSPFSIIDSLTRSK